MTRSKKSRKPGTGSSGVRKADKDALAIVKEKRLRKKTGNKPGTRQVTKSKTDAQTNAQNKDPRLGSKKPIELIKVAPVKAQPKVKAPKVVDIPQVRVVDSTESDLMQELARIEEDEQLQTILAKQEDDITLSESEVEYFNKLMDRHQEISSQLGLDEEDDEEFLTTSQQPLSEEDLWRKFNDTDFDDEEL